MRTAYGTELILAIAAAAGMSVAQIFDAASIKLMRLNAPYVMLAAGPVGRPAAPATEAEWSFWPSSTYIPGPGCYGIQIIDHVERPTEN